MHMKKDCHHREANSTKKDVVSFMADANVAEKRPRRILFKLDSECSDHLICEKAVFIVLKKVTTHVEIKKKEKPCLRNRSAKSMR